MPLAALNTILILLSQSSGVRPDPLLPTKITKVNTLIMQQQQCQCRNVETMPMQKWSLMKQQQQIQCNPT